MSVAERLLPAVLPFEIEFEGEEAALFQDSARAGLRLPIRRLGGVAIERFFEGVAPAGESHGFQLYADRGLLIGCAVEPVRGAMERAAADLYRRLLAAAGAQNLYRIWNYVPDINGTKNGLEHYRAFSAGRARAFEQAFGAGYRDVLPAASAVGCAGEALAAVFVAGSAPCRRVENPEQLPAYRYPPEHGPRSPSFCRASTAEIEGRSLVFISGTAAIKGHCTVAPDSLDGQLDCTLHNLGLIFRASGRNFGAAAARRRMFRVYLRRGGDLARARDRLEGRLGFSEEQVVWLQSALCRRELLVEVEATAEG